MYYCYALYHITGVSKKRLQDVTFNLRCSSDRSDSQLSSTLN